MSRPVILPQHPVIIEAPSPHDYLDVAISRINGENAMIRKVVQPCSCCPDEGDCFLAGDPSAPERCIRLRRAEEWR